MLKCSFGVYPSVRINLQALLQQICQLSLPGKKFLDWLEIVHCSPVTQILLCPIMTNRVFIENLPKLSFCLLDHPIRKLTRIFLNQYQMLKIVVSIKQQVSSEKLWHYASDRPYISQLVPFAAFQDYFRRPVLSCANYWTVEIVVFSRPSKINHPHFIWFRNVNLFGLLSPAFNHE